MPKETKKKNHENQTIKTKAMVQIKSKPGHRYFIASRNLRVASLDCVESDLACAYARMSSVFAVKRNSKTKNTIKHKQTNTNSIESRTNWTANEWMNEKRICEREDEGIGDESEAELGGRDGEAMEVGGGDVGEVGEGEIRGRRGGDPHGRLRRRRESEPAGHWSISICCVWVVLLLLGFL